MQFVTQHSDFKSGTHVFRAEHADGVCFEVGLTFGTGKFLLNFQQRSTILAGLPMLKDPTTILEMYGEADPRGSAGANMLLSERRMRGVQELMKSHGVPRAKAFSTKLCKALGEYFENSRKRPDDDPIGRAVRYFIWSSEQAFKEGITAPGVKGLLSFGRAFPETN